ncbi:hypothetical protein BJY01DRAFT_79704 [Aspergillus pseudoustus]|uniref:Nephrocystin 3-like N-terminal domain-containing protein n=1 Tax=Aspergillus pseudoustus TaxID=1810923 RepID=A0ABR4J452_9EURO
MNAYKSRTSTETDPLTLKECKQILLCLLSRSTPTALIIDALDECTRPQELLSELKELSAAMSKLGGACEVRLCMSSRDDVNLTRILTDCESISITPNAVAGDFEHFVNCYVELQCKRGHELGDEDNVALRERLVSSVLTQGQGGFRWAQLQLQYLLDQEVFNPRDLEQRLKRLESGQGKPVLNDAYNQLYTRKTGEDMGEIT